jgi:serine/threonine-protein kinase HipA
MAIAGFQDKLPVYEHCQQWHLIDDYAQSTTEILKPEPSDRKMSGMTTNEMLCMRLAPAVGLPAAEVRLIHLPEPVLVIRRFDRVVESAGNGRHAVRRVYCIDGCQALDLAPDFKYERPYGDSEHVRNIRMGASMRRFFKFLKSEPKVRTKASALRTFLRWAIFQILIGNTDAHAKNVSFFCCANGIELTPTYDLVCTLAFDNVAHSLAMAIGDNFDPRAIKAYDWALFAYEADLDPTAVSRELLRMSTAVASKVGEVAQQVVSEGGDAEMVSRVLGVIKQQCEAVQRCAAEVPKIERHHFE